MCGLLAAVLLLTACGDPPAKPQDYERTVLEVERPQATEFSADYEAYPRPQGETKKQGYVANLNYADYAEIFAATTLQGIVNRTDPELYVLSQSVLTGYYGYNSTEFWLDALKETYPEMSFSEISGLEELVARYRNRLRGAVVYHERLTDKNSALFVWEKSKQVYGDAAVVNLTQMACGQYDAIPLTSAMLTALNAALSSRGVAPLEILFDTTSFLETESGLFDPADRKVWRNASEYALSRAERGEWNFSEKALMHRASFALADNDYSVSAKLFTFNRIKDVHSLPEEREVEARALALTPRNTPVMGVYHATPAEDLKDASGKYIGYEEHNTCAAYNALGKFWYVTYGTFNLSYTSGLPKERAEEKSQTLVYDEAKTYVAFSFTEGDNNSYAHYRLSQEYEKPERGSFAMTWQLSQGIYDLNPNVIRYMNANNTDKDGYAFGSSGIGYVIGEVTDKADFYGLSDSYCEKSGISCVETFSSDPTVALEYAAYTQTADVFCGFAGEYGVFNTDESGIWTQDGAVFRNVWHTQIDPETLSSGGNLLSIRFHGWDNTLEDIAEFVSKLPEGVVTVTQSQLVSLLRQKSGGEGMTETAFGADHSVSDEAYLYDAQNCAEERAGRTVSESGRLVYRIPLDTSVSMAEFTLGIAGTCKVRASSDCKNWLTLSESFSLPEELLGGPVYLLLTPEGEPFTVTGCAVTTNLSGFSSGFRVDGRGDRAFWVSGGTRTADGYRAGVTDYRFPLAPGRETVISVRSPDAAEISISPNGKTFYPLETVREGGVTYALADGLTEQSLIRISGEIRELKVTPVPEVGELNWSPCGNPLDRSACVAGWQFARGSAGKNTYCEASGVTGALTWVFRSKDLRAPMLTVRATGNWKLEISSDGKNFSLLASGKGESEETADVSAWLGGGKRFYLRFSAGTETGTARLYRLKWNG